MNQIKHAKIQDLPTSHKQEHGDYEYFRRKFIPFGASKNTLVSVYEIPPGKSAYPYHYHHKNEETFYIISGQGTLRTPEGVKTVTAGDLLFFPTGPEGAHKLTNTGDEPLMYLDFDVVHDLDVSVYPDSGKMGIWGMGTNKVFPEDAGVDYYQGE